MKNPLHKIASLRTTLAFALGILLASYLVIPTAVLLILTLILVSVALFLNFKYRFGLEAWFGWTITVLFVVFGSLFYTNYNKAPRFYSNGVFVATVLESGDEKPNSYKSVLKIEAVSQNDSLKPSDECILVYFEKTEKAGKLMPGNTLVFEKSPEEISNNGNPFEFDYKSYLGNKKIYRRIYLAESDWELGKMQKVSPKTLAEKYRNKLLSIYHSYELGEQETEILSALTLGYKRGLDPETKRIFSSAGAMHVLAVSGLHVGILFLMYTLLFGFLKKHKHGKIGFVLLALFVLWSYAFITGLSPSVMRASTMFSLVCIAANINRRANIYNTLSFSAFVLLVINPNNLFEVGFQLSYAAVFGIVFLQPKLATLWPVKNKILKFFWALLTVSIAAQIATFPITSYYFNQFPTYFWLSNLLVIPAVFALIVLGILLLAFSWQPVLGAILAFITKWILKIVYVFLRGVESLPFAVNRVSFSNAELIFLILAFISLLFFIEFRNIRSLKMMLVSSILLAVSSISFNLQQLNSHELVVYNNSKNMVIHLINGDKNYIISENELKSSDYITRDIAAVLVKKKLKEPVFIHSNNDFADSLLFCKNNLISFNGRLIWFKTDKNELPENIKPDLIITNKGLRNSFVSDSQFRVISYSNYNISDFKEAHILNRDGAFIQQW